MGSREVNLNDLLSCCRRELALRTRVYPKRVAQGWMSEKQAEKELELMRQCVDFLVDAIFRSATGQGPAQAGGKVR